MQKCSGGPHRETRHRGSWRHEQDCSEESIASPRSAMAGPGGPPDPAAMRWSAANALSDAAGDGGARVRGWARTGGPSDCGRRRRRARRAGGRFPSAALSRPEALRGPLPPQLPRARARHCRHANARQHVILPAVLLSLSLFLEQHSVDRARRPSCRPQTASPTPPPSRGAWHSSPGRSRIPAACSAPAAPSSGRSAMPTSSAPPGHPPPW